MDLPKLGLKLWSINVDNYLPEAVRLHEEGWIDYVELYSVPDSSRYIKDWKTCPFPFIIHGAHSMHGFNLSNPDSWEKNQILFSQALEYARKLSASRLILHPGVLGTTGETIRQLQNLIQTYQVDPGLVLMENKPLITLNNKPCVGAEPSAIKAICEQCHTNFVLDISHAIKYAIGARLDWQQVLTEFMKLTPLMLHVCDGNMDTPLDQHLHIGKGEMNFSRIFEICRADFISLETHKDSQKNLDDFIEDVKNLKKYL